VSQTIIVRKTIAALPPARCAGPQSAGGYDVLNDQDEDAGQRQGRENIGLNRLPQLADRNDHQTTRMNAPVRTRTAMVEGFGREAPG